MPLVAKPPRLVSAGERRPQGVVGAASLSALRKSGAQLILQCYPPCAHTRACPALNKTLSFFQPPPHEIQHICHIFCQGERF